MAYGLNKVMLIGRLGKDPELKYTANSVPVCNFTMATNESYKNQEGALVERTEWHNIVVYRKAAEIISQYVRKGSQLYVEGKLQTRNWEDKTHAGVKHYITEIVVDDFMFLDSKGGQQGGAPQAPGLPPEPTSEPKGDVGSDLPF